MCSSCTAPPAELQLLPRVTIANLPPYNSYTLLCNASFPQDQLSTLNISWWDFDAGAELLPNGSITIQTSVNTVLVGGQSFTNYSSELTISEIGFSSITETSTVFRGCIANVVFRGMGSGEAIPGVYALNATSIIIRGWKFLYSPLLYIPLFTLFLCSSSPSVHPLPPSTSPSLPPPIPSLSLHLYPLLLLFP